MLPDQYSSNDGNDTTPIKIENPKNACTTLADTDFHELYFSPSTTSAYRFVCFTIISMRAGVNITSKMSLGESGLGTFGSTGELYGCTNTGVRLEVQFGG